MLFDVNSPENSMCYVLVSDILIPFMGTTVSGAKRVHATDPLCTNNNWFIRYFCKVGSLTPPQEIRPPPHSWRHFNAYQAYFVSLY